MKTNSPKIPISYHFDLKKEHILEFQKLYEKHYGWKPDLKDTEVKLRALIDLIDLAVEYEIMKKTKLNKSIN